MTFNNHPHRLITLPFHKLSHDDGIAKLERLVLYGITAKLWLFNPFVCKDIFLKRSKNPIDPNLSYPDMLKELGKLSDLHQARYILTGSLNCNYKDRKELSEIQWTFRLYDNQEKTLIVDAVYTIHDFDKEHSSASHPVLTIDALNQTINEISAKLFQAMRPEKAASLLSTLTNHKLTTQVKALEGLVETVRQSHEYPEQKISHYEAILSIDPHLELAYFKLGDLYKHLRQYKESVSCYKKALEVNNSPNFIKARYATEAGVSCALMNRPDLAIRWWEQAILFDDMTMKPYLNLAHTFEEKDQLKEAETYFLKAQAKAPTDTRTYYGLARIYSKTDAWSQALSQYKQSLHLDQTEDPWCHSNIALCYMQMGVNDKAVFHLKKTQTLDPQGEAGQYAQLILEQLSTN